MKTILLFLAFLFVSYSAVSQDIGFRGLNLGMTLTEVNELVSLTPWVYQIDMRRIEKGEDPNNPQRDEKCGGSGCSLGYPAKIGNSAAPDFTMINFFNHRVYSIGIFSPPFHDTNRIGIGQYSEDFLTAIKAKYGDPTVLHDKVIDSIKSSIYFNAPSEILVIAEWKWLSKTFMKNKTSTELLSSITLGVSKANAKWSIIVLIKDEAAERLKKELEKKESGF